MKELSEIAKLLTAYLAGQPSGDLSARETQRQLINRVMLALPDREASLLRQSPLTHKEILLKALTAALERDPVARHLASQLGVPEPADSSPHQPRHSGGISVEIDFSKPRVRAIRILFLSAAPDGMASLRTDREVRDIQEVLRQSRYRDRFDLIQEPAVRISDLQRCLLQHRPDIVHFSGHGYEGAIMLEGRNGKRIPVLSQDLADLFSVLKGKTRCVVLNACYSSKEATPLAEVIDAVIARPKAVRDSAAILFSTFFYQALAFGRSVRGAFDLACVQLRMEKLKDSADPVLLASRCDPDELRFAESTEEP